MLKALADKYKHLGIDKDAPDWEIVLFNHLCGFLNIETEMIDLIDKHNEEMTSMNKRVEAKQKIEDFICDVLVEPDSPFKAKLKQRMDKQGLSLKFKNDKPYIHAISYDPVIDISPSAEN